MLLRVISVWKVLFFFFFLDKNVWEGEEESGSKCISNAVQDHTHPLRVTIKDKTEDKFGV